MESKNDPPSLNVPKHAGVLYQEYFRGDLRKLLLYLFMAGALSIPIAAIGLTILLKHGHSTLPPPDDPHVGWVANPESRGTLNIISVCVSTIFACNYVSVHVGLPEEDDGTVQLFLQRCYWFLANIFAPELMVLIALCERWSASSGVEFMRRLNVEGWTMRLAFFADMGGFRIHLHNGSGVEEDLEFSSGLELYEWISEHQRIFESSTFDLKDIELDVRDRSKRNGVLKVFTCVQALWMLVQTVARLAQHLPVTELEVMTCAYIICALVVYSCWLHKPYGVQRRVTIHLSSEYAVQVAHPHKVGLPIAPFLESNSSLFNSAYYDPDRAILTCSLLSCSVGTITSTMLVIPFWKAHFVNSSAQWIWRACSLTQVSLSFAFASIACIDHWNQAPILMHFQLALAFIYDTSRSVLFALICLSLASQPVGAYRNVHWVFGMIPHWN